jgi:hypothetical protein
MIIITIIKIKIKIYRKYCRYLIIFNQRVTEFNIVNYIMPSYFKK